MAETVLDNVKEYYGKILQTNQDLKTNACVQQGPVPKNIREALQLCHEEVLSRYYGCGLVFPSAVKGMKVLDFGSGAGRDCFVLSKLVGEKGFVTGVDMTKEQVDVADKYIPYHMEKFGYTKPNVDFKLGYIENLKEAGILDDSCDVIISNCVINLSPDKPAVFKEAYRVLKEGGELYFSDVYADRNLPENVQNNKELWGECLAGALYWKSFIAMAKEIGFLGPYLVNSRNMTCGNERLGKILGDAKFVSATYRLFKPSKEEQKCGCSVKYKDTIAEYPTKFAFDTTHTIDSCNFQAVTSDVALALKQSRYSAHFVFEETKPKSSCCTKTATTITDDTDPFVVANQEQPSCCKKAESCCS